MDSLASRIGAAGARGGLITIAFQVASAIVRLVGLVILARLIDPSVFGLVAIVTTIALFAQNIITMGLVMASAQYQGLSSQAKSALFLINLGLGMLVAGGLFLLAEPLASVYDAPALVPIVQWLSAVPLLTGLQGQFRVQLMTDLRFFALSLGELVSQTLALVAAIALAAASLPYHAVVAQPLVQGVVGLIAVVCTARWLPGRAGGWRTEVMTVCRIGAHVFGMNVARNLGRSALLPLTGLGVSPAALGAFDRAQQLAIMPVTLTVDQLQRVAVPVLSKLRGDTARMVRYLSLAQVSLTYLTGGLFAIVAGIAVPLIDVLFGEGWRTAGIVLGILAAGSVFRTLANSVQWLFLATESTGKGALYAGICQPLIVAVSLVGLPWGVVGVAIMNSIAWALYWPALTILATRAARVPSRQLLSEPLTGLFLFALPIAACVFAAVYLIPATAPLGIVLGIVAGCLCGIATLSIPAVRRNMQSVTGLVRSALGGNAR